jgi:hypothetical protein
MRKLTDEEVEWIKNNKEEFIKSLSDKMMELDYEINLNKEVLDSLPTSDDRKKWVKDMLKKLSDREVKEPLSEELKQKGYEFQQELRKLFIND